VNDAEYALTTALDAAHLEAVWLMTYEAGIHTGSPVVSINIVYGADLMPDHYDIRCASGCRLVMPWAVVDRRADHVGVDHWDSGDQTCPRGCAGCTAGCKLIMSENG